MDRVETHVREQGYHIVRTVPSEHVRRSHERLAVVRREAHYTGLRLPVGSPHAQAILDAARAASDEGEVVAVPTFGGSVPIVHFADVLGVPAIIVPMANHDNNQHDADENIRVGNLWYGIRLMAALMTMEFEFEAT